MVVTSGLPLLMVKGKFTSLETMTVDELETFIPFMTQCSVHRALAATVNDTPVWWLMSVQFRFPLRKPRALSMTGYRRHLVSVVCRCYYYHEQQYILQFCSQLSRNPESVIMKANDDDTTSLYNAKTRVHILTFNNQNQEYDRDKEVVVKKEILKSPRRCLLPSKPTKPITDVYLCENCDSEFNTQAAISAHERQCYDKREKLPGERVPTPADLLGYLQLGRGPPDPPPQNPIHLSLNKNRNIEFSSALGMRILKSGFGKKDAVSKTEKLIHNYEAYCFVSPRTSMSRESYEFRTSFRISCKTKGDGYGRPYCFSKKERKERYLTLMTGLNEKSRKLQKLCKCCSVPIPRLTPAPELLLPPPPPLVPMPTSPPSSSSSTSQHSPVSVVDLCSSDEE